MKSIEVWRVLGAIALAVTLAFPASATDQLDLTVALKTLPLLTVKIGSPATVAIVFDPANADSKADADGLKALIDGGLEAPGGVKLVSAMVGVGELGKLSTAKIVVVTKGVAKSSFDALSAAVSSAGALSLSTDLDCVKTNKCVLGILSKPSVEIYFSKTAAESAKINFVPAFTMLAKTV